MIVPILLAAVLVIALAALAIALGERRHRRRSRRRNGNDGFIPWDWPLRPINGHDHPEPPELEREPSA